MMRLLLIACCALCAAAPVSAQPQFPIPRAEAEFRALMPNLERYTAAITRGDERAFVTAVASFGPLDLQVGKAATGKEAARLKNLYFGICGAASELPLETVERWGLAFERSPDAVKLRRGQVTAHLPAIRSFVRQMRAVPQITVLAQWGFKDEWRVNNAFRMQGQLREATVSPVMGFVPSGDWEPPTTLQAYLSRQKVPVKAGQSLLTTFRALPLIAVVRQTDGGVRAIRFGVSNNEWGLLFTAGKGPKPQLKQRLQSGQMYAHLEEVEPGVFYYEAI